MAQQIIFHVDVNSAFLSWEAAYRKRNGDSFDLMNIPSVVGGDESSRHGIVLAKSIPAKKMGVVTGESLFSARKKCPNLVVIPPTNGLYTKCSREMMKLLREYTPNLEKYSVDESFMMLEESYFKDKTPLQLANEIKERIKNELGFTVNVGISTVKLLAKMASDFKKPDNVHTLYKNEIAKKMWHLPVGDLFMVGRRTEKRLKHYGILTIGILAKTPLELLEYYFKSQGKLLWEYANGIDNSKVRTTERVIKSIGNSKTLPKDIKDIDTVRKHLLSLCETIGMRLRIEGMIGDTITVVFRNADLETWSVRKKVSCLTDCTNEIYSRASTIVKKNWNGTPLRLIGVRASGLQSVSSWQTSFFDNNDIGEKRELDKSIDLIREKYGNQSIKRAVFIQSDILAMTGKVGNEEESSTIGL